MSVQFARNQAEKLIERLDNPFNGLSVDVEYIAEEVGLKVIYDDLGPGPDISGLLVSNKNGAFIFVQKDDHPHRQRFTIAHEIGHFVLRHQFESGKHVHVDRGNFISQRGPRASEGLDPKEIEANQFAASLLLPVKLVQRRVKELVGDGPLLDYHVTQLAKEFAVSEQAMTIRLTTLGLL